MKKKIFLAFLILLPIELLLYLYVDLPLYLGLKERSSEVNTFFTLITELGVSEVWLVPASLFFLIFTYIYKRPLLAAKALFLFSSVAISGAVNMAIKMFFGRNRPVMYDWYPGTYGFDFFQYMGNNISFPSGHANTAFTVAMVFYFWFPKQRYWIFLSAFMVGISRVVIGKHYLSDVIAGGYVAIVVVLLWREFYMKKGWQF